MTDITAPYRLDALGTIKQSHRQQTYALLYGVTGNPARYQLLDGDVTFAEDWSPYAQASVTIPAPGADVLALIDPRKVNRLDIYAGYVYPGADPDVQLLAAMYLAERRATTPGGSLTLSANSGEMYAQENKWLNATQTKSFPGVLEALQWVQAAAAAPLLAATWESPFGIGYRPELVSAVTFERGADYWSIMDTIALSAGLRIYDDAGIWRAEPKSSIAAESSVFLQDGPATIVAKTDDVLSRNGYYSAAALTYKWKDAAGDDQEIVGVYRADLSPAGGTPYRVFTEDRTGPITQYDADTAAQTTVANLSSRGDSYVVDAVSAYWLRPGMTVQVRTANGADARHIVRSVVFHLNAGTMTVTTRAPSDL